MSTGLPGKFTLIIVSLLFFLMTAAFAAQPDSTSRIVPSTRFRLSLQPKPLPETDFFFITEAGMLFSPEVVDLQERAYGPNYMIIWDAGLMKNLNQRTAIGASLGFSQGNESPEFSVALKPRIRYWIARRVPLDLSPGITLVTNGNGYGAKPRFMVDATLMYNDWIGLTTRLLTTNIKYSDYGPEGPLNTVSFNKTEFYAGLRLGSYPGLIGGGAIAVAWAILSAIIPED